MIVYLLDGTKREHKSCTGQAQDGVLYVRRGRYLTSELEVAYPLTSIERWEPCRP